MENHPKQNKNTIKQHQDAIIDLFPEAKKSLYGESPYPDFVQVIPTSRTEALRANYEKQDAFKDELKQLVPDIYESYVRDLTLLQRHNPEATLLDVHYDAITETISAPPVYLKDTYISHPLIGGSFGNSMRTRATIESDYFATIQKRTLLINDEGIPEDLYLVEITRHNSTVHGDVHDSWTGRDGDRVAHIAVDPTYDDILAETLGGSMNQAANFESSLNILKQAFPKTTK